MDQMSRHGTQGQYFKPKVQGYVYLDKGNDSVIYRIYDYLFRDGLLHDDVSIDVKLVEPQVKEDEFPVGVNRVPLIIISPDDIPTRKSFMRMVASCAFEATNTYIERRLGGKLDNEDKDWYSRNALCNEHGLPQANTFTVLQQLVEVYGIGISNIVVPRNARIFSEYKPFLKSLGCNPFFLVDGHTTNEEALAIMFPDLEERDNNRAALLNQWKFECRDEPLKGCVMMRIFQEGVGGHNGGSTYRSPRNNSKIDNWTMCILFDRTENINLLKPLELPDYKEYGGALEFDFLGIKVTEDGRAIRNLNNKYVYDHRKVVDNRNFPQIEDKNTTKKETYPDICPTCMFGIGDFYQNGKRTCIECGNEVKSEKSEKKEVAGKTEEERLNEFFGKNGKGKDVEDWDADDWINWH